MGCEIVYGSRDHVMHVLGAVVYIFACRNFSVVVIAGNSQCCSIETIEKRVDVLYGVKRTFRKKSRKKDVIYDMVEHNLAREAASTGGAIMFMLNDK